MLLVLALLVIVVPIVEIYVIVQVSHVIGGWDTIGLLVAESLFGAWLLKRQGLYALRRVTEALDQGRVPGRELVDGFLVMTAGVLMITPGFLTDLVGFLLLLPPSRAVVRKVLIQRFQRGVYGRLFGVAGATGAAGGRFVGTFRARPAQDTTGHEADRGPEGHPPELRG
ncbi:MAG TPA: FxsA family protein [Acidimicrobiales bacterium]